MKIKLGLSTGIKVGNVGVSRGGGGLSDTTRPTVAITSTESSPTFAATIPLTITFSESVTGFLVGDITVVGCTLGSLSGSGAVYTVTATPTANAITVDIAAGVAADGSGNTNTAATQFAITSLSFGLVGWYDFSDISTLFQDAGRTSAITADAQTILGIADKSAAGNHGSHANGCLYKVNIANSKSAGFFNGATSAMSVNGMATTFSGSDKVISIFCVFKSNSTSGTRVLLRGENTGDADSLFSFDLSGTNYRFLKRDDGATLKSGSAGTADTNLHQLDIVCNGTQVTGTLDGTAIFTNSDVDVGALTLDRMTLGNNVALGAYLNGYEMEMCVYSNAISAPVATSLRTYLKTKWATP